MSIRALLTAAAGALAFPAGAAADIYTSEDRYPIVPGTPELRVDAPGVLITDSIPSGPRNATVLDPPDHGSLTLQPDGGFTYRPQPGWHGLDPWTYRISNGSETADGAVLMIVNRDPVAVPDAVTVRPGVTTFVKAPGVLANDTDGDGDPLTAERQVNPEHGAVEVYADGSFRYTPNPGWVGLDAFSYHISDGIWLSNSVYVTVTVGEAPPGTPSPPGPEDVLPGAVTIPPGGR